MIIELNNLLKERGLEYKIHLSDACGSQSMWIESLDPDASVGMDRELHKVITSFFEVQRIPLEYSADRNSFWVLRG